MAGTLINCFLAGNYGLHGGAAGYATLINCVITNNSGGYGGGTSTCNATNCLLAFNQVTNSGGGSWFSTLVNCTVVSNSIRADTPGNGGGVSGCTVFNSIVFGNTAPKGANYFQYTFSNSCTTPLPAFGAGNFTNAPIFVDPLAGDFHLQSNSSCINAGRNIYISTMTDLEGNPRISGGSIDLGAYEFQNPASIISYHWLQNFGLPTDGSADFADPDHDGMNNWSEWRSGTDPTNALSVLRLTITAADPSGITLTWPSGGVGYYYLQRATDLSANPAFHSVQSNIVGQTGSTSYKDTTATGKGPYFYRVGVQ
jgi:hypothetical protein